MLPELNEYSDSHSPLLSVQNMEESEDEAHRIIGETVDTYVISSI